MDKHCGFEEHANIKGCHISPGEIRAAEKLGIDPQTMHWINEIYVESILETMEERKQKRAL